MKSDWEIPFSASLPLIKTVRLLNKLEHFFFQPRHSELGSDISYFWWVLVQQVRCIFFILNVWTNTLKNFVSIIFQWKIMVLSKKLVVKFMHANLPLKFWCNLWNGFLAKLFSNLRWNTLLIFRNVVIVFRLKYWKK